MDSVGWGVPDWTDNSQYPESETLTSREWWWQFTRRRPDYRSAWINAAPSNKWGYRYSSDPDAFQLKFSLISIYDPAKTFSDWDLMHMMNRVIGHVPYQVDEAMLDLHNHREQLEAEHGIFYYRFDLNEPLVSQIEDARSYLFRVQAEIRPNVRDRRPRVGNWPMFLRILDARDAGATYQAIADNIWPGQQKTPQSARDAVKAATDLRDNFPL